PCVGKASLLTLRHRVCKRSLELHQLGPFDLSTLGTHASTLHPPSPIDDFRNTHEHFFGITSPQGTCPFERPRINDGNLPTRGTALMRNGGCCSPSPDNDQIKLLPHKLVFRYVI